MDGYWRADDDPHNGWHGIGVLFVNHGSPDAPAPRDVRRYLRGFLSDPRLIELPRALWLPILYGIILPSRPRRVAKAYQRIWTDEGPPINTLTGRLAQQTADLLAAQHGPRIRVEFGMTYGQPGIGAGLKALRNWGARRILVLPLYPQYSATTVGSVFDRVSQSLSRWRWLPELRFVTGYEKDPQYIKALADSVRSHWAEHGRGEKLVFSYHGIPQRYADEGDPYPCFCHRTARLTAERLGLDSDDWAVSFQSRFGPSQWLQPYTLDLLTELGQQGRSQVDIVCPGFAVECLETVEEVADELARDARRVGVNLRYVPCLNDSEAHARVLAGLINDNLGGNWMDALSPISEVPAVLPEARDLSA